MPEGGGDEPVAVEHGVAALAAPHPARRLLEDARATRDGGVVRRCGPRWTPPVRRGRTAGTRTSGRRTWRRTPRPSAPSGPPVSRSASGRVDVVEDAAELLGVDLAGEPERRRCGADPLAGRLPGAGVVLLGAAGDGVEVVLPAGPAPACRGSARPDPRRRSPADDPAARQVQVRRCSWGLGSGAAAGTSPGTGQSVQGRRSWSVDRGRLLAVRRAGDGSVGCGGSMTSASPGSLSGPPAERFGAPLAMLADLDLRCRLPARRSCSCGSRRSSTSSGPNPLSETAGSRRRSSGRAARLAARHALGDLQQWQTRLRALANHLEDLEARTAREIDG